MAYVEAVAMMAKYNPFLEKAGMKKLAVQHLHISLIDAVKKLQSLGVDLIFMASEKYSLNNFEK